MKGVLFVAIWNYSNDIILAWITSDLWLFCLIENRVDQQSCHSDHCWHQQTDWWAKAWEIIVIIWEILEYFTIESFTYFQSNIQFFKPNQFKLWPFSLEILTQANAFWPKMRKKLPQPHKAHLVSVQADYESLLTLRKPKLFKNEDINEGHISLLTVISLKNVQSFANKVWITVKDDPSYT